MAYMVLVLQQCKNFCPKKIYGWKKFHFFVFYFVCTLCKFCDFDSRLTDLYKILEESFRSNKTNLNYGVLN